MATYRQILNRVLTALSEDPIPDSQSSLSDSYHKLLGLFVNEIKETVEDSHNWRTLRTSTDVTVAAGTSTATITGATERSRVLRVQDPRNGRERAVVYDVTDANQPYELLEMDIAEIIRRGIEYDETVSTPSHFAVDMAAGTPTLRVWPTPSGERTVRVTLVTPQAELGDSDLDVEVLAPARPISTGATWYALEERGEELGVNGTFTQELFNEVLGSYVARDAAEQGGYEMVPE